MPLWTLAAIILKTCVFNRPLPYLGGGDFSEKAKVAKFLAKLEERISKLEDVRVLEEEEKKPEGEEEKKPEGEEETKEE